MANINKSAFANSRYVLTEGRQYGKIDNATRVVAAAAVLDGEKVSSIAKTYKVSTCSVRNWIKTLAKNNPNLV